MGWAVLSYETGSIQGEHHRQILQADIMEYLIVSPLQKTRIDRHDREYPFRGQSGGKGHAVLLRDAYVEKAFRKFLRKDAQACSFTHSCRNGDNLRIFPCHFYQGIAENLCVGRRRRRLSRRCRASRFRRKRRNAVKL
ncbi:MAG: hypothetical protein A4E66_01643 [Syntrophus sp. PtaB.Bin001]|nr:MAG: hypothetical protein A4E66_01643 [Syntrophus sp. PtaB.Bin001]